MLHARKRSRDTAQATFGAHHKPLSLMHPVCNASLHALYEAYMRSVAYEKAMDLAHDTESRSEQNVFIFLHVKFPHGTHNVLNFDCIFARFKASSSEVRLVAVVGV